MFKHRYLWFSCLFVTLMSLGGAVSSASPAAIEDNGDFFSASAKAEAARNIGELEKAVHKDLAIETFKEAPADVAQEASSGDKAETNRVFEAWAEKQAKAKHVNGVYILLVKSPAHLQVLVGNDTQKRLFTLQDRETLVSTMLTSLRAKKYDEALLDAVNFVSTTMRAHAVADLRTGAAPGHVAPLGEVRRAQSGFPGWLIPVLLVVVVLWVIRVIFRGISGGSGMMGGGAPMGPMYGGGGGGGGFFSSMLGGIFGAAAGIGSTIGLRATGDRLPRG